MANTTIQIRRSTITSAPTPGSLSSAEPAYSYLSGKLFIGNAAGDDVIAIGGKYYIDVLSSVYNNANANSTILTDAYNKANAANYYAYLVDVNTKAAFAQANSTLSIGSNIYDKANSANYYAYLVDANSIAAFIAANTANVRAVSAYTQANTANDRAVSAYTQANTATTIAISAYANSNTKLSTSGGVITGDLSITGNLTLTGNTVFANVTTLTISDPLLYLAGNNYTSDIVDIGFVGNYVNTTGQNVHTGLFRDATIKEYYLFQGYDKEPDGNDIDPNDTSFSLATLNATVKTSNLILGGTNTINWLSGAYNKANSANYYAYLVDANTIAAYSQANTGSTIASNAYDKANSANYFAFLVNANTVAAYGQANTGVTIATNAYNMANTANVNAANASYLSVGTVPSGRLTGDYSGITGLGTIISGTWNADIITVPYGGSGRSSFSNNGILFGNTTGSIRVTAAGSEGNVLQVDSAGIPVFSMLDGGSF
mgnify:CR=1 FL=1